MRARRVRAREVQTDFRSTRPRRTGRPSTTGTTPSKAVGASYTQGDVSRQAVDLVHVDATIFETI